MFLSMSIEGMLENMRGLNIGSNPITSLNAEIINSGYKAILQELSNIYNNNDSSNNIDGSDPNGCTLFLMLTVY